MANKWVVHDSEAEMGQSRPEVLIRDQKNSAVLASEELLQARRLAAWLRRSASERAEGAAHSWA